MRPRKLSLTELESTAVKWWPDELAREVADASPDLLLRQTHEVFIKELSGLSPNLPELRNTLKDIHMPMNLFLKHLLVLADFGGEKIKRVFRDRVNLFVHDPKTQKSFFEAEHRGIVSEIEVSALMSAGSIGNAILGIDGPQLAEKLAPTVLMVDVAMIALVGALATDPVISETLAGCELAKFVQDESGLSQFLKTRYLTVSRIVQGANSNSLGQAVQSLVGQKLAEYLGADFKLKKPSTIVLNGRPITSDLLIEGPTGIVAIEVAFQVTTNSVIERKGNEASQRRSELNSAGIASCYVLDGIGIFERQSALEKILRESDFSVNLSESSLRTLAVFVREWCT